MKSKGKEIKETDIMSDGTKTPIDLDKQIKDLESFLNIDNKASKIPAYFFFGGILVMFFSPENPILLAVGFVLEIIGLIFVLKKGYFLAYNFNRAIVMYVKKDYKESKKYLERLSKIEKEKEPYKKMRKLLEEKLELGGDIYDKRV